MRVAFIHSGYSRHLVSGIIRVENELVRALRASGHTAEIMPWTEQGSDSLVSQQYARIIRPAAVIQKRIRDYIVAGRFDLVVFQGVGYPETRTLLTLKRQLPTKFIIIQHGWPIHNPAARFLINGYMQTIGHLLLAEVDGVIAVSNYVLSHLAEFCNPEDIKVIYPAVDAQLFYPQKKARESIRKKYSLTGLRILIGVGKLASHKNYSTLLRALALISDTDLLLVGSGSRTKEDIYKSLAQNLGIAKRVRFLGTVPNMLLPELYSAADAMIHPSKSEALGIVLLEALATETPVVAANVGGIPEVVIDNFSGLLYQDAKDHIELADRIESLLSDNIRLKKMGQNGRAFVKARFDWQSTLPKYIATFEKVVNQKRKATKTHGVFAAFT